eukprot:COSAG02_NODE_22837_length_739_cov_0.857812_1_plen_34_part_10
MVPARVLRYDLLTRYTAARDDARIPQLLEPDMVQ